MYSLEFYSIELESTTMLFRKEEILSYVTQKAWVSTAHHRRSASMCPLLLSAHPVEAGGWSGSRQKDVHSCCLRCYEQQRLLYLT